MAVETLEIETFFGKCKCCLKYGYLKTMWEPHVVNEENEIYGQMLTQCFSITWTIQGSEQDDQICEDCIWKVREAFLFKKQVQNCQRVLENGEGGSELQAELDESYAAEYLDEEILEHQNDNSNDGNEKSLDRGSTDERETADDDDDDDEENKYSIIFSENEEQCDENQNPEDEDDDDDDDDADSSVSSRKRKPVKIDTESDPDAPKPKWPKKVPKAEQWKTYKQYSEETFQEAVNAVMSKRMNQKQASKYYKVPRKTLSAEIRAIRDVPHTPKSEEELMPDYSVLRKHRENIRTILEFSNATPIRGYWGGGYVCAFCPKQFLHAPDLKAHTKTHGNISLEYTVANTRKHSTRLDITDLKCKICGTLFEDLLLLKHHLKDQHNKPMHFDINNHLMPFKFDTKDLQCAICRKVFTHFKGLSEHVSDMHMRNYVCGICDRGFVNRSHLSAHRDSHRLGMFKCHYCSKAFDTRRKKTSHERTHIHPSKSLKCRCCEKRFVNEAQRRNHEQRSHPRQKTFRCNACDQSFSRQRALDAHSQREHAAYRPYKCPEKGCDKAFYLNRTLQAHVLTHDDARPYLCEVCQRSYRDARRLRDHMTVAHCEREFKCKKCAKSYVNEDNLKRHVKDKH